MSNIGENTSNGQENTLARPVSPQSATTGKSTDSGPPSSNEVGNPSVANTSAVSASNHDVETMPSLSHDAYDDGMLGLGFCVDIDRAKHDADVLFDRLMAEDDLEKDPSLILPADCSLEQQKAWRKATRDITSPPTDCAKANEAYTTALKSINPRATNTDRHVFPWCTVDFFGVCKTRTGKNAYFGLDRAGIRALQLKSLAEYTYFLEKQQLPASVREEQVFFSAPHNVIEVAENIDSEEEDNTGARLLPGLDYRIKTETFSETGSVTGSVSNRMRNLQPPSAIEENVEDSEMRDPAPRGEPEALAAENVALRSLAANNARALEEERERARREIEDLRRRALEAEAQLRALPAPSVPFPTPTSPYPGGASTSRATTAASRAPAAVSGTTAAVSGQPAAVSAPRAVPERAASGYDPQIPTEFATAAEFFSSHVKASLQNRVPMHRAREDAKRRFLNEIGSFMEPQWRGQQKFPCCNKCGSSHRGQVCNATNMRCEYCNSDSHNTLVCHAMHKYCFQCECFGHQPHGHCEVGTARDADWARCKQLGFYTKLPKFRQIIDWTEVANDVKTKFGTHLGLAETFLSPIALYALETTRNPNCGTPYAWFRSQTEQKRKRPAAEGDHEEASSSKVSRLSPPQRGRGRGRGRGGRGRGRFGHAENRNFERNSRARRGNNRYDDRDRHQREDRHTSEPAIDPRVQMHAMDRIAEIAAMSTGKKASR